jgi:hypothetical protein
MVVILMVDHILILRLLWVVCALNEFSNLAYRRWVDLILLLGDPSFVLHYFRVQFIVELLLSCIICSKGVLLETHFVQRERKWVIFIPLWLEIRLSRALSIIGLWHSLRASHSLYSFVLIGAHM